MRGNLFVPFHLLRMSAPRITWDTHQPGLGIRNNADGSAAWVFKYRWDGKQIMLSLADANQVGLDLARSWVREYRRNLKMGVDPAPLIKDRLVPVCRQGSRCPTIAEFAALYMQRHAEPYKRSAFKDRQRIDQYILPRWGTRRLDSISHLDCLELHQELGAAHPFAANRLLELLRVMFSKAQDWEILPAGARNPARGVHRFREEPRHVWITREEMPRLLLAIKEYPDPIPRAAIFFLLFTGLRVSEALNLRWQDIPPGESAALILQTKRGTWLKTHLNPLAARILESLPRSADNPWVFPGRFPGQRLARVDKAWYKIRARAGIEHVRIHDLRRTVGSWIVQDTQSIAIVGEVLNQSTPHVTRIYARFADENSRTALDRYSAALEKFMPPALDTDP